MEYILWVALAAAIVFVFWLKNREGNPSEEEQAEMEEITTARATAAINNITGNEHPNEKIPADIVKVAPPFVEGTTRTNVKPATETPRPPSPPPMRSGSGKDVPLRTTGARPYDAPYGTPPVQPSSGISATDVLLGILAVDALTDDKPQAQEAPAPARDPEPVYTPDPEPTRDSGWSGSDNDTSSWSGSDSSSDSSSSSSSDW